MKVKIAAIAVAVFAFSGFYGLSLAKSSWRGETLSLEQAEKRWGRSVFSEENFKNGSPEIKAKMAVEIVEKKIFVGSTIQEVETALGRHDGHYKNDFIPAYALNEGWKKNEDTWQLVFLPNSDRQIKDVFIHKNCCSR